MQNKFVLVKRRHFEHECSICTEKIAMHGQIAPIWTCYRGCKSIFHLECLRAWGIATIGHSFQFSCPNCRCTSYDFTADVNGSPRCYCGKKEISVVKKKLSSSSLSCGAPCNAMRVGCHHPCPLQCHSGPCPPCSFMGSPEPCATGPPHHLAQRQRRCGSAPEEWYCNDACPRIYSNCFTNAHRCPSTKCHSKCEACPELISISCECSSLTTSPNIRCNRAFDILTSSAGRLSCQQRCKKYLLEEKSQCILICHPPSVSCASKIADACCFYGPIHPHSISCKCGKESLVINVGCATVEKTELGYVRRPTDTSNITCDNSCGKSFASCSKHLCDKKCCINDEDHVRCTQICNKRLACSKSSHRCLERCHPERPNCRPCPRPSFPDGWNCPCGKTKVEGPLGCSWVPPSCKFLCNRARESCDHSSIPHPCHSGDCPPCTMPVFPKCGCGRVVTYSVPCMFSGAMARCGLRCNKQYPDCPHTCASRCHWDVENCPPCPQKCQRKLNQCGHPCALVCGIHPGSCVCNATVSILCPCGRHKEEFACSESTPISCTDACLNAQRFSAFAEALNICNPQNIGRDDEFSIHAALIAWPMLMDVFTWARSRLEYLLMIEGIFSENISSTSRKRWVDLPPAGPIKREMTIRIANNYHLQTIELDCSIRGSVRFGFPDDYPTTVPKVPSILLSKIVTSVSFYDVKVFLSTQKYDGGGKDDGEENNASQHPCGEILASVNNDLLELSFTDNGISNPSIQEESDSFCDKSLSDEDEETSWVVISTHNRPSNH
ncbi:FKBP12-associated protein [Mitosporidium daphniae]